MCSQKIGMSFQIQRFKISLSLCFIRYLYQLALAIDANFRLKQKERGIQDKSLSDGLAYIVQSDTYTNFLEAVPDYNEVFIYHSHPISIYHSILFQTNTCDSTLHAVDNANKKGIDGLAATGIGGVSCARHCFNCKLGFADLQKGKRYSLSLSLLHRYSLRITHLQIQKHGLCHPLHTLCRKFSSQLDHIFL